MLLNNAPALFLTVLSTLVLPISAKQPASGPNVGDELKVANVNDPRTYLGSWPTVKCGNVVLTAGQYRPALKTATYSDDLELVAGNFWRSRVPGATLGVPGLQDETISVYFSRDKMTTFDGAPRLVFHAVHVQDKRYGTVGPSCTPV